MPLTYEQAMRSEYEPQYVARICDCCSLEFRTRDDSPLCKGCEDELECSWCGGDIRNHSDGELWGCKREHV